MPKTSTKKDARYMYISAIGDHFLGVVARRFQDVWSTDQLSIMKKLQVISTTHYPNARKYGQGIYELFRHFLEQMRKQHEDTGFEDVSKEEYAFSSKRNDYLVLLYGQIPVGFIHYGVNPDLKTCYTNHLYVADADFVAGHEKLQEEKNSYLHEHGFNRLKLGLVLLATANLEAYAQRNARHFFLFVSPKAGAAMKLYNDMGYTNISDPKVDSAKRESAMSLVARHEGARENKQDFSSNELHQQIEVKHGEFIFYKDELMDRQGFQKSLDNILEGTKKDAAGETVECQCCGKPVLGYSMLMPRLFEILESDHLEDPCF